MEGGDMTAIWFCADLHVSHRLVSELRGFDTTAGHDAALAANWDRVVRPEDQVWVLGDVTGTRGAEAAGLEWVSQRPGIKHLIAGNHDASHPMHSEAHKVQRTYLEVFASVQQSAVRKIAGSRVLLSHFPYTADHVVEARYPEWRFPDTGKWLLHGHTHSTVAQRGRELHVGLDAHGLAPVSLHWVEARINEGVAE
jgi:calcineurin-like phosphoesterase family protein